MREDWSTREINPPVVGLPGNVPAQPLNDIILECKCQDERFRDTSDSRPISCSEYRRNRARRRNKDAMSKSAYA